MGENVCHSICCENGCSSIGSIIRDVLDKEDFANLHNYAALDTLENYLVKIANDAVNYDIVSAAERRCYNIVAHFLPNLNVISNNALLLMYKRFAQSYMETKCLPRALICDDLAIHGRGMSKFLYQFESLIIDELMANNWLNTSDDFLHFHMHFTESITIYIYAESAAPLLFHERYISRIRHEKLLYPGKLRDLSMQLSTLLKRLEVANTAFAYSYRSNALKEVMTECFKQHEGNLDYANRNWKFIKWEYGNEPMLLAVRFYGKNKIERISTIRYFPERMNTPDQIIISYTILGNISEDTLDAVSNSCSEVLINADCVHLASILREKPKALRSTRVQLLSTILSILDFVDFCNTVSSNLPTNNPLWNDLRKIARNYGSQEIIAEEFKRVAISVELQIRLRQAFEEKLFKNISPLLNIDISECEKVKLATAELKKEYFRINDIVANEVYAVGADAEMTATMYNNDLAQFHIEDYQSIKSVTPKSYSDGMATFVLFSEQLMKKMNKSNARSNGFYAYCYIAALIAMMDSGVLGMRIAATQYCEPAQVMTVMKAGELATFHIPKKYALFIPAFAEVEENNFGNSDVLERKVMSFIDCYLKDFDAHSKLWDPVPSPFRLKLEKQIRALFGEEQYEQCKVDIGTLYRCGQSFRGWNFSNLTHQRDMMYFYLQQKLVVLAQRFV